MRSVLCEGFDFCARCGASTNSKTIDPKEAVCVGLSVSLLGGLQLYSCTAVGPPLPGPGTDAPGSGATIVAHNE